MWATLRQTCGRFGAVQNGPLVGSRVFRELVLQVLDGLGELVDQPADGRCRRSIVGQLPAEIGVEDDPAARDDRRQVRHARLRIAVLPVPPLGQGYQMPELQ